MKSSLLLAIPLLPLACAGAEPAPATPQTPVAPPVVVDLTPPPPKPAPTPAKVDPPKEEPAPEAKAPEEAEADKPEEGKQFGMIGILRPDGDAGNAKGNMWGDTIGDSFGQGGLGLAGIGTGGGGRGEGIGLGSIGVIGHGSGTGTGFGSGHGRLGGAKSNAPKVRMGATTVSGKLPPEVIQRIVRQNFGRFRLCYEKGLLTNPKLQGTITIKFVIEKNGSVSGVSNGGSSMPSTEVLACVQRAFNTLSFPEPESDKVVVTYPILFSPGDAVTTEGPVRSPQTPPGTSPSAPAAPAKKP